MHLKELFLFHLVHLSKKGEPKIKKDNSIQIINLPLLVKIKRSKLVIFKLPLSSIDQLSVEIGHGLV